MKIEISPDEARLILKHRTWGRLVKTKRTELVYLSVMAPPVVVVFSIALLFISGINNVVPSVFLAMGLLCLPLTFKALKKYKVYQSQIQAEMIAEENENRKKGAL
jgi:ABC-type transport system involved in cytochrome bd biosynthesis fused ATPase/permease subunit